MVRICFEQQPDGNVTEIDAAIGESLMEGAKRHGVDGVIAECGGSMVCGTCHVYVGTPWFDEIPEPSAMEWEMLEFALHRQANSRLACQVQIAEWMDGMVIGVPPSQR